MRILNENDFSVFEVDIDDESKNESYRSIEHIISNYVGDNTNISAEISEIPYTGIKNMSNNDLLVLSSNINAFLIKIHPELGYKTEITKIINEPSSIKNNKTTNTAVKFCIYCGAKLRIADKFCAKCGKKQD